MAEKIKRTPLKSVLVGGRVYPTEPIVEPLEKYGGREKQAWEYYGLHVPEGGEPTTGRLTGLPLPERGVEVSMPTGEKFHLSKEGYISSPNGWSKDLPLARLDLESGTVEPTNIGRVIPAVMKMLETVAGTIGSAFTAVGMPLALTTQRVKYRKPTEEELTKYEEPPLSEEEKVERLMAGIPLSTKQSEAEIEQLTKQYEGLPWWEQLAYETPALLATGGLTATGIKGALKGGGALTKAARVATAPVVEPLALTEKGLSKLVGLGAGGVKKVTGTVIESIGKKSPEELPTIAEVIAANYDKNVASKLGANLANTPILGKIAKAFNPMTGAKTAEERAVIAHMQLLDTAESNAAIRMTKVWANPSPFIIESRTAMTRGGLRIKTGSLNVTNVTAKSPKYPLDINAIAEFPERYYLSSTQRAEIDELTKLLTKQLALERSAGVKVLEIELKEGQRYFPRFVKSVQGAVNEVRKGVKKGIGAKQAFQRGRWYEEVRDGILAGKDYGVDLRGAVEARLKAGNKAIADKYLADFLKKPQFKSRTPTPEWRTPIVGKEGVINSAGLQGRVFPIDIAENANRMIEKELSSNEILRQMAKVNAVARLGQTAIDTGYTLIQGLLTLSNSPKTWGKAFYTSMRTLVTPRYASKWATTHSKTLLEMSKNGAAPFMSSEFTEAARAGGILERLPVVGRLFKRFGAAFEIYLDSSRTMLYEALAHKATTPIEKTALTNVVDNMVGISSSGRLGVSTFLRQLESNSLYAPRYYRAFVGLTVDSFQGGLRGNLAREALAKFTVAVPTFMSAVALALGQTERITPTKDKPIPAMFDPRTGEFMTVEIAGTHMGLGGVWIAGFRLLGGLTRTAKDNPKDFLSIDPHENPLLRYGYGRSSPVAGTVIDLATGSNYLGERLDTPQDYLREVIDKTFPFWAAGQITDVPRAGWEKGLAEWWGLRAWMVQYNEQARQMAESLIPQIPPEMIMPEQKAKRDSGEKLTYDDLNNGQRAWLLEQYAEYREKQEQVWEQRDKKGTDFDVVDAKVTQMLNDAYHADLNEIAGAVINGQSSIRDYTEQSEFHRRIRQGQFQYRSIFEELVDPDEWERQSRWLEENIKPEDLAYEKYMELRGNPPKKGGVPDWDAWKVGLDAYLAALPPEYVDYFEMRRQQRFDSLPEPAKSLEILIYKCEQGLDSYYDIHQGTPRLDFRRSNPDIDAQLFLLGRVSQVQTANAMKIVEELRAEASLPDFEISLAERPKTKETTSGLRRRTIK